MGKTAAKRTKRSKTHPYVPPKKTRRIETRGVWYLEFRRRIETILERTAASRREIDRMARGADITSLAHLPVVTFPAGRPPKPPGLQKLLRQIDGDHDHETATIITERPPAPPMAPPVPYDRNDSMDSRGKVKKAPADSLRAA